MVNKKTTRMVPNIPLVLERFAENPILKPNPGQSWESKAVLNPAAIYESGKVHLLYRAIGDTDVSVLGYASSADGLHFQERLTKPAYVPREPFEGTNPGYRPGSGIPGIYASGGGGMGGCEDPRLTRIDDRVYLTYVAYDGSRSPRVALSSINAEDFLNKRWNWKKPVLISAPHIVDKNACILPEKINGKYVIFHRVFPNILVDFVDDLDFDGKSRWLEGHYNIPISVFSSEWDSLKVGCGPPPIRTKYGWLLIYHAVGCREEYHYKIGAMLLDAKDPTKVLARSKNPILEPQARYENEGWKAGVVYPCGAVIINERLHVYYGGADTVVCVASVKLNGFIEELVAHHKVPESKKAVAPPPSKTTVKLRSIKGYCLKCQTERLMKNPEQVVLKNKRRAITGTCLRCGTKMFKFIKSQKRADKI
jgi:predicted GH43/DUF377 family glycosyl hydrolase/RNase P subunit RPR2